MTRARFILSRLFVAWPPARTASTVRPTGDRPSLRAIYSSRRHDPVWTRPRLRDGKRRDRPYQAGRSKHWVKVKNRIRRWSGWWMRSGNLARTVHSQKPSPPGPHLGLSVSVPSRPSKLGGGGVYALE